MEQELSFILLIFAGVILLLLFIYSFRTRVNPKKQPTQDANNFHRLDEDEKDILTMPFKKYEKKSTQDEEYEFEDLIIKASMKTDQVKKVDDVDLMNDIEFSTKHVEPKLNKMIIEDDSLIISPTIKMKSSPDNVSQSPLQEDRPIMIRPTIIKETPQINRPIQHTQHRDKIETIKLSLKPSMIENSQIITKENPEKFKPGSLLVLHVMPEEGKKFMGYALLQALLSAKLHFGKMAIFHRYEHANVEGKILFSVAQVKEPGTFNMNEIESFECSGLVLFMQLLGSEHNLETMELFIQTAQQLADSLGGVLMGKRGSAFTADAKKDFTASVQHHLNKLSVIV